MFRTDLLSIIRSINIVFTAIGICHTSCCEYGIKTPNDGQYVCPKHLEFFTKIKLRNSASCWFLLQECITMCGSLNVKFAYFFLIRILACLVTRKVVSCAFDGVKRVSNLLQYTSPSSLYSLIS